MYLIMFLKNKKINLMYLIMFTLLLGGLFSCVCVFFWRTVQVVEARLMTPCCVHCAPPRCKPFCVRERECANVRACTENVYVCVGERV